MRQAAARELDAIHVRDPVAVRDEVEAAAVRGPLGIDVLGVGERGHPPDGAGLGVQQRQLVVPVLQILEVRGESVGDERDLATVGGPRRLEVGVRVVGQPLQLVRDQVVAEQVAETLSERRERDRASVGRPRGVEDLPDVGDGDVALRAVARDVEHGEHRLAVDDRAEGEALAGRVPCTRGVDELETLVMGVERRLDDAVRDLTGARVREVQVDREQAALGEERQSVAVRAQGRGDVQAGMLVPAHQQATVRLGHVRHLAHRLVGGLDLVVPLFDQRVGLDAGHLL